METSEPMVILLPTEVMKALWTHLCIPLSQALYVNMLLCHCATGEKAMAWKSVGCRALHDAVGRVRRLCRLPGNSLTLLACFVDFLRGPLAKVVTDLVLPPNVSYERWS